MPSEGRASEDSGRDPDRPEDHGDGLGWAGRGEGNPRAFPPLMAGQGHPPCPIFHLTAHFLGDFLILPRPRRNSESLGASQDTNLTQYAGSLLDNKSAVTLFLSGSALDCTSGHSSLLHLPVFQNFLLLVR